MMAEVLSLCFDTGGMLAGALMDNAKRSRYAPTGQKSMKLCHLKNPPKNLIHLEKD